MPSSMECGQAKTSSWFWVPPNLLSPAQGKPITGLPVPATNPMAEHTAASATVSAATLSPVR